MLEHFYLIQNVLVTPRFLTLCASVGNERGFSIVDARCNHEVYIQLFTFTLWPAVCAVGLLFILILEFSIRNMSHFLNDVHTVEVLNEPVDDSGSEGFVSEMEYSPSDSGT